MNGNISALIDLKVLLEKIAYKGEIFDERFFFLVEDFDLAWRARNAGYRAMYVPTAVCYHYRGSSGHKSFFKQYLSIRNRYFLLIKNMGIKDLGQLVFAILFYDIPRLVFICFVSRRTLKVFREIWDYYPQLLKKRYNRKTSYKEKTGGCFKD